MKSSAQLFSSETQDFHRHQARTRPTVEPAMTAMQLVNAQRQPTWTLSMSHARAPSWRHWRRKCTLVRVSFYHPLNTQPLAFLFPMSGRVTFPLWARSAHVWRRVSCLSGHFASSLTSPRSLRRGPHSSGPAIHEWRQLRWHAHRGQRRGTGGEQCAVWVGRVAANSVIQRGAS